jgi:hypothetical protein
MKIATPLKHFLNLIEKFRTTINKIEQKLCPTCNERFLSIKLVMEECRRCYNDKTDPKKFSTENNMNPGDLPKELQGFTEIEKMLIVQIFPIISVYCLREGQYSYRGNVINFPQDIHEFTTRLPRYPSSLDVLVVRQQSADGSAFRDFNVRRDKIAQALSWLK